MKRDVKVIKGDTTLKRTASGCVEPVSYTHLDVYKRQQLHRSDDSGNPESFEPIPVIGNYVQL